MVYSDGVLIDSALNATGQKVGAYDSSHHATLSG